MKYKRKKVTAIFACAALLIMTLYGGVYADEKIGNLVFNAMKKIQETHETFLSDVKTTKAERKAAIAERSAVKKQYKKAKDGSLDKRELHARFSYAQAKVYRALYSEAKLTNNVTKDQIKHLNSLYDSITSGEAEINAKGALSLIEAAKPFLENGESLLTSLAQYRDMITDPLVNSKLNAAYATAQMLSKYIKHIGNCNTNKYASQQALKQKVGELIEQLNALYVQTDIFVAMIQDKTTVLKMINQLAASEAAIWAVADGNKIVAQLSSDIMSPLMDVLSDSDEDLTTLVTGVLDDDNQSMETSGYVQSWTKPIF
jgi:hypothetical protein